MYKDLQTQRDRSLTELARIKGTATPRYSINTQTIILGQLDLTGVVVENLLREDLISGWRLVRGVLVMN